jgi:hypothetical protein
LRQFVSFFLLFFLHKKSYDVLYEIFEFINKKKLLWLMNPLLHFFSAQINKHQIIVMREKY